MHVTLEYHKKVVAILVGILALLLILLGIMFIRDFTIKKASEKYLQGEEVVIIKSAGGDGDVILPIKKVLFEYIEIVDSCGPYFDVACLNARSGPGEDYPIVTKLRRGIVLKVGGKVERDNKTWYKIIFDEWIRYPERVTGDFYVAADYVQVLLDEGNKDLTPATKPANITKKIIVSRTEQKLYAYDGDQLFMEQVISTGLELTPTPKGTFTIFKKTPSRYMQGPIPGITEKYYDLPGVPWNLYFTYDGAVIHGTYWHENFGKPSSNGCINLPPARAYELYKWTDVGTPVIVRD
ncbi:MAG: L,D-transpeptidase family protein [bacterium]|nr:L,D-transpeptidase family protein [bacterium]